MYFNVVRSRPYALSLRGEMVQKTPPSKSVKGTSLEMKSISSTWFFMRLQEINFAQVTVPRKREAILDNCIILILRFGTHKY